MGIVREKGSLRLGLLLAALIAASAGLALQLGGTLDWLERDTVHVRFKLRDPALPTGIAVVGVDEVSFNELQEQWPFPRTLHARLVDRLREAGAKEIVYDVQFTEPTKPAADLALYDAIGRAGGAVLATSEIDDGGHSNVLGGDGNLAQIGARAAAANLSDDDGGFVSHFPRTVAGLDTLAVATAEREGGHALSPAAFARDGAWIDYRGGPGTFPTYSFSRVLSGLVDPGALRGKIVVVGASAPTLRDVHVTPTTSGRLMSGPEVQANAIWTALHGLPLRDAPRTLDLLLVALLGMLAPLLRLRFSLSTSVVAACAVGPAYVAAAQLAFGAGTVVAVAVPVLALAFGSVAMIVASHAGESAERRLVARDKETLEALVRERTRELSETQLEVIQRLAVAAEIRDEDTGIHIQRIGQLCHRLALAAGMSPGEADLLRHASVLHDVGKIGIPDSVLLKPGKLDADEWEIMKRHTTIGADILAGSNSGLIRMAETVALTHHERWDGSGYPEGLSGEEIPLVGRICALADVLDALVSERPYKRAWPLHEALAEIERSSGSHFDPRLAAVFLDIAPHAYGGLGVREREHVIEDAATPVPAGV